MQAIRIIFTAFCALCAFTLSLSSAAETDWTLMIYMAADNDLEQAALIDLDEIEAGMPEQGVEIIVLIDRAEGYADGVGDWTDARLLRMRPDRTRGEVHAETLQQLGEINTGDPDNLKRFLQYSQKNFPAKHYGLVLWDHGGGWQGMADDEQPGGDIEHDNLTLDEVSAALRAGLPQGQLLDLIGFDMCLMAQLEVGYEVAEFARYMVASQAIEPGYGWPYDVLLPEFGQRSVGAKRLAQNIVRKYADFTKQAGERIATQSAFDLAKLETVRVHLDALTDRLAAVATQQWPNLSRGLFWGDSFETGGKAENLRQGEAALASSDLLDVVKRTRLALGRAFPAEREFQALLASVSAAVLDNHVSDRHRLSHGVSIYAPPTQSNFNQRYQSSRFAQNSRWDDYLLHLHGLQQANRQAPKITAMNYVRAGTNQPVQTGSMLDSTTLKLTVEGNNLLWVSGLMGRYDEANKGHVIYAEQYLFDSRYMAEKLAASGTSADLLIPDFVGDRASLEMEVSPSSFAISNGEIAAFATFDTSAAQLGQDNSASIQALIKREGQGEHRAVITFDMMNWRANGVVLLVEQSDGRMVPRGLQPEADDEVTLLYKFVADGKADFDLVRGETMAWKDGLELILDEIPEGRYTAWAVAENLSGETDVASTTITTTAPRMDVKAGFDAAKKLSIDDLGGSWTSVDGETAFKIGQPLEPNSSFAQLVIDPSSLTAKSRDFNFVVQLDTRLLPTLHLLVLDAGNNLVGRDVYMLLANANAPNRLWVKTLIGAEGNAVGEIVEVVRAGRGPAPGPAPGPMPTPEPPQPAVPQLAGIWQGQTDEGYVMIQLAPNGELQQIETAYDQSERIESWGRYQYDGKLMRVEYTRAQLCNSWGCEPYRPEALEPFPVSLKGGALQTPWALLYRQQ
ncbi:MAG: clostripain-related cysteine peptidase [Pseudomonadales bacterium]